ncbi:MFS transporter [Streptomyces physcomitrii]|uniref:MFS transporter n=1 Tax=Streptomyces physcomitrii TaxID=2724184 RepID=UPI0033DED120
MTSATGPAAPCRRGGGAALLLLALAQLVISLDYSIVWVALPGIGEALGFSDHGLQWVVSAYVVTTGGFLLLGGRAVDRSGRRRIFVAAALVYAGASLLGALATAPWLLVCARAVQGIGGSLLFPATLSLLNTLWEEGAARNRALAVWGAAGSAGLCFGSLLGGVLVQAFGWTSVFWVNVPLAAGIALVGRLLLPPDGVRAASRAFGAGGSFNSTAGLTLLVYLLVDAPVRGWTSGPVVLCALCSAALLGLFTAVERRSADPLVPVRLMRHRALPRAVAVAALYNAAFASVPYFLTLYFQRVHGYGASATGWAFLVPALVVAVGAQLGSRSVAVLGTRRLLAGGLGSGALGAGAMAFAFGADSSYALLLPGITLLGLGQGAAWTALWIAASSRVAADDQGTASGLVSTGLQIGGAVGLAVLVGASGGVGQGSAETELLAGVRTAVAVASAVLACGAGAVLLGRTGRSPQHPRSALPRQRPPVGDGASASSGRSS